MASVDFQEELVITEENRSLRFLDSAQPLYMLPKDPFVEDALIPAFKVTNKVDCMVGFFSSEILADLAPGLATFIAKSNSTIRLVVSPFLRPEDQDAIRDGVQATDEIATRILTDLTITEDALQHHTLKCLSWLIHANRVEIKVALMRNALFHPKVWLFEVGTDIVALHGSSNGTSAGITRNIEQIAVSRSWQDQNQLTVVSTLVSQFERFWGNEEDHCKVIEMPEAVKKHLLRNYDSKIPPTEEEIRELYSRVDNVDEESGQFQLPPRKVPKFVIPNSLQYEAGQFAHQGKAVKAWCDAGYSGVLEMATGSGKTITAMICAYKLYEVNKPLLIVVAAPYIPLIQQWCDEIEPFGLEPVDLNQARGARGRAQSLGISRRRLQSGRSSVEIIVVSHAILCDSRFKSEVERFEGARLLIADEVHNLGSEGFISEPPSFFEYRLGLSATPIRQYDEDGTEALFSFFGSIVFEFTLKEAIGHCLVEYNYYVHPVELTSDEMDQWYELTAQIKANAWRLQHDSSDEYLMTLFRKRRLLLETAKNKINALEKALSCYDIKNLRFTLIYSSDKSPQQLKQVNALLKKNGVLFHQLTHEETASRERSKNIIHSFQEGYLQILTAKRVLDEGVNIPQIKRAFILASTTLERQWIQRRGRLLRTCKEIGKTKSEIHDFIALPPDLENIDDETRVLIGSELKRIQNFANIAMNAGRPDGSLELIDQLARKIYL